MWEDSQEAWEGEKLLEQGTRVPMLTSGTTKSSAKNKWVMQADSSWKHILLFSTTAQETHRRQCMQLQAQLKTSLQLLSNDLVQLVRIKHPAVHLFLSLPSHLFACVVLRDPCCSRVPTADSWRSLVRETSSCFLNEYIFHSRNHLWKWQLRGYLSDNTTSNVTHPSQKFLSSILSHIGLQQ